MSLLEIDFDGFIERSGFKQPYTWSHQVSKMIVFIHSINPPNVGAQIGAPAEISHTRFHVQKNLDGLGAKVAN